VDQIPSPNGKTLVTIVPAFNQALVIKSTLRCVR
jgi:hypothetical protein